MTAVRTPKWRTGTSSIRTRSNWVCCVWHGVVSAIDGGRILNE
ncbi:hypothetical protein [Streptomyces jeddahensis]|nr:hypothetical protein [Streptomyces jeddahensis]